MLQSKQSTPKVCRNVRMLGALGVLCGGLLSGVAQASAAAFTPGNLVVYRVGDGTAVLTSAATAVFLDEYTPTGTIVQSIALPTADNGSNQTLTASGSATSEGLISRSADGRFILLTGYDASVGTLSVASTATTAVTRVIGRIDTAGTLDTTTTTTSFSGNNIRSATSSGGTNLFATGGNSGVVLQQLGGSGPGTVVSNTFANLRQINILRDVDDTSDQLYVSAGAGALRLGQVGEDVPTTTGQTTTTLPGLPTATGIFNAFIVLDLDPAIVGAETLYVADESTASTGGIQKYSRTTAGGTFVLRGNITAQLPGTATNAPLRGLTASVAGTTVTLFATTSNNGAANTTVLYSVTDSNDNDAAPSTPTATQIVTGATNTAFRGVAFAPVAPNTAPVAANDAYSAVQNQPLTVAAPGVLANDTDADGNTLTVADNDPTTAGVQPVTAPTNGTLTLNVNGSFTYTPDAGFSGTDTFTYRATDGTATSNIATVTSTVGAATSGALITELRFRGTGGTDGEMDEYVEVRNLTNTSLNISGWKLLTDATGTDTVIATVPPNVVLLPRAHYLFTNTDYSLTAYAASNQSMTAPLDNGGATPGATITLRNAANLNVDVVSGLTAPTSSGQTAFVRLSKDGAMRDTNDASDFLFVSPTGASLGADPAQTVLGVPGPQNRISPVKRDDLLPSALFDTTQIVTARPNQVRVAATAGPDAPQGTILFRRQIINNTGQTITRLRFRIVRLSTLGNTTPADLRFISSPSEDRVSASQNGGVAVRVFGTSLESPAIQGNAGNASGGYNSSAVSKNSDGTFTLNLAESLLPFDASDPDANKRNYNFLFRVITPGTFAFAISFEALPTP